MKQKELYKTAIYCRLSLDDGSEGASSSIHKQKMLLEKYCKDNGYEIYDYYIDDGYSGLNYNRPNFQRMLQDIENGKIDLVITKDLSRLGRDYIMTGYYTEIYFNEKGVRYIAVNDNIDTINDNNDIAWNAIAYGVSLLPGGFIWSLAVVDVQYLIEYRYGYEIECFLDDIGDAWNNFWSFDWA